MKLLCALMLAALLAQGCAGVAEFQLPREFKGKKQVQDPPLSRGPAPLAEETA